MWLIEVLMHLKYLPLKISYKKSNLFANWVVPLKKKFPPLPGLSYVSYWAKINRVCIGVLRSHIGGWIFDHGWQGLVGLQHNRAGLRNYIDWIGHTLCIGITTALSGAGWFNNNTLQHIIGWLLITGLGHHNFPIVCILISNNQS